MANERTSDAGAQTPAMRQYFAAKQQYPDTLMFCRIGDFYELFYEDAVVAARELQLTLTARDKAKQQPMCGVPYHSAGTHIYRDCSARDIAWRSATRSKTRRGA